MLQEEDQKDMLIEDQKSDPLNLSKMKAEEIYPSYQRFLYDKPRILALL